MRFDTRVRDLTQSTEMQGDWVIGGLAQVGAGIPSVISSWGSNQALLSNKITYLIVPISPGEDLIPARVRIDELQCSVFDATGYAGGAGFGLSGSAGPITFTPTADAVTDPASAGITGQLVASNGVAAALTGSPTTAAWTGTVVQVGTLCDYILQDIGGSVVNGLHLPPVTLPPYNTPPFPITLGGGGGGGGVFDNVVVSGVYIAKYVVAFTGDFWLARDPLLFTDAARDDWLSLRADVYSPMLFPSTGNGGREWAHSLPYPIIIGSGQCLAVTVSTRNLSTMSVVPFIRARVTRLT